MPHIIVEYSQNLTPQIDIPAFLSELHATLGEQGDIEQARIKTRAIPLHDVVVGKNAADGRMIHITLLLLEGRDGPIKQRYGRGLHTIAKNIAPDDCAVTLEIRDMMRESYIL